MKKKTKTIEERLSGVKFLDLSQSESSEAWSGINSRIENASVFGIFQLQIKTKNMIPLLIGALIFASAGGTVAASNSAVPGDLLFPVDRAVENVRLAFAGKNKAKLEVKFSEERLDEVDRLIAKARLQAFASTTATSTATSTPKAKGRVAVGVNVAIDYLNRVSADLSASGNTEAALKIEGVIDRLETMINNPDVRVALKQNGDFMLKIKGNTNATTSATSTATSSTKIRINTSGHKDRIEIREDGDRFRLEIKDNGDLKIKTKTEVDATSSVEIDDDEDDDDDKKSNNSNRGRGKSKATSSLRIELDDDDED